MPLPQNSNRVGYQTITVAPGSTTAMGVQFENVATPTAGIPIKSILKIDNPLSASSCDSNADQIWTYGNGGWTKYYYYKKSRTVSYWCAENDDTHTELGDDIVLKSGQSFFFRRSENTEESSSVTLAGGVVPLAEVKGYPVKPGSTTAMAWPWPEAMKIKDFNNYNPNPLSASSCDSNADQIWTYGNGGWTKYYLYKKSRTVSYWCAENDDTHTELGDDKVVASGSAFFFRRSENTEEDVTISFAR